MGFQIERLKSCLFLFIFFILFVSIGIYKTHTYGLSLSPDSYVYLDIAENIKQGRGLVHSYILTDQVIERKDLDTFSPVGLWGPGFPIIISCLSVLYPSARIEITGGLSVFLSLVLLVCIIILWGYFISGNDCGFWCIFFILCTYPVAYIYSWIWSEGWAILALFVCFWLLTISQNTSSYRAFFLSGFWAGIAFSIRYAFFILLPFIILFHFLAHIRNSFQRGLSPFKKSNYLPFLIQLLLMAIGWSLISVPIMLRNYLSTGSFIGSTRKISETSLWDNLYSVITTLQSCWFANHIIPWEIQGSILISLILIFVLAVIWRKQYALLKQVLTHHNVVIWWGWSLFYFAFISIYASLVQIDELGIRLLFPTIFGFLITAGLILGNMIHLPNWIKNICLLGTCVFFYIQPYPQIFDNFFTTVSFSKENMRAKWICENTKPQDWIVGDSTFDLSIACPGKRSICFIPASCSHPPPDKKTVELIINKLNEKKETQIFIVIRKGVPLEEAFITEWRKYFGPVITDLVFHKKHDGIEADEIYINKRFIVIKLKNTIKKENSYES